MGGEKKRKLQALEDAIDRQAGNGDKNGKSLMPMGTKGLELHNLKLLVCMDYLGDECFIDIQGWRAGQRFAAAQPSDVHASLQKWNKHWKTGGGRMSRRTAVKFKSAIMECDAAVGRE